MGWLHSHIFVIFMCLSFASFVWAICCYKDEDKNIRFIALGLAMWTLGRIIEVVWH